jgi:hypothetical protein
LQAFHATTERFQRLPHCDRLGNPANSIYSSTIPSANLIPAREATMATVRVSSRFRLTALFEWLVAAAFLLATFAVGSMVLRQIRVPSVVRGSAPAARPIVASIPPSVPARAVSVPVLPFLDGKEVRVGETASAVAARLGRAAEVGKQEVDRGSLGERLTRFYEYGGSRFILVFEPFERNGEARVAAIYLP